MMSRVLATRCCRAGNLKDHHIAGPNLSFGAARLQGRQSLCCIGSTIPELILHPARILSNPGHMLMTAHRSTGSHQILVDAYR